MHSESRIVRLVIATIFLISGGAAVRCQLPSPDDSKGASSANLHGSITEVNLPSISIRIKSNGRKIQVELPPNLPIFTVFGGDGVQDKLLVGQEVWIWFENCKRGRAKTPVAAYFQIYSADPDDRSSSTQKQ
ncbi:hypothetical protein QTI33_33920 [Variovorax sp. J22P271]|uniref:hypothetical protein n=1 Tax=Variovorax davisae TaxID=3053515 RepID=UPI002575D768|nr:hypothetical protein [Variovorax sp. J22P271]MDM0037170.1 hypothetical protein [Variovorax sp. J22P271]